MPSGSLLTTNKINKSEPSTQELSVSVGDLPYFKTHYEDKFFPSVSLIHFPSPPSLFSLRTHPSFSTLALSSRRKLRQEQNDNVISSLYVICEDWRSSPARGTLCIKLNPRKAQRQPCVEAVICLGLMSLIFKMCLLSC